MRAIVTGATGHLGSHLGAALRQQSWEVLALARPESHLERLHQASPGAQVLRRNLRDLTPVDLRPFRPDVLFHLAWEGVTSDTRDCPASVEANIINSLSVFE